MFGIGQPELIVIIFILLLFFGPSRLPKLSKTLGESARALRDGFTDGKNDKSLKDITQEVTSSAREIKKGITEVRGTQLYDTTEIKDTAPLTETHGYGKHGYGKKGNI